MTESYFAKENFVDPAIICNSGLTKEEFATQGTGNRISLHSGPTSTNLIRVPLNESEILEDVRCLISDMD